MAEKQHPTLNELEIKLEHREKKKRRNAMIGATFLMATSAVGPGFLTQTAVFTEQLLAS